MQKEVINSILEKQKKGIVFEFPQQCQTLQTYEIRYSAVDTLGDLLFTDNNSVIYRGIKKESLNKFIELYETGILQTFVEYNFIPKFKISNYRLDNYSIILEIEKLRVIYPYFWSYSMIKAEAILKLNLIEILDYFGYGLVDGHSSNATFKDGKPIFFDFGSFAKGIKSDYAKLEIIRSNILPLIMMSIKKSYFPRYKLLGDSPEKILPGVDFERSFEVKNAIKKFRNILNCNLVNNVLNKKTIKSGFVNKLFNFETTHKKYKTPWKNYYPETHPDKKVSGRFKKVIEKINEYCSDCKTFLDLAGNKGYLAYWVKNNTNIQDVSSSDYDTLAIESGIKIFKDDGINFYVLNCMSPFLNIQNFKSDIVCAMAVTHHLLLTQKIDINYMFNTLKSYVGKYIFIEFCPLGMYSLDNPDVKPEVPDFYTIEWFEEYFKKHFELINKEVIEKVNIKGETFDHRILYVGKIYS